jgi:hypothetical protein
MYARFQAGYKGVPEVEGLVYVRIEANRLEWLQRIMR